MLNNNFKILLLIFCILVNCENFTLDRLHCLESDKVLSEENEHVSFNESHILGRVKRSFGGKEPVNMTLVNENTLGPPGFLALACSSALDLIFHISGYIVLGMFL
jgi:hypothetical protein